ncbi:MAG: class I SAM-dependent methyltransferase [Burkholderiales bacterium]
MTTATSPLPSAWVKRWSHLVPRGARVLDVACGSGRHVHWFVQRGCAVTGVDRDPLATQPLRGIAEIVEADIEGGPWPFTERRFDAVVVTNYLWRPRLPDIVAALAPGGVLLYETFAAGNETVGKPSNANFLLQPGELLRAAQGLRVVAFEDGFEASPDRFVQRIVALREPEGSPHPGRHDLAPAGR